MSIVPHDVANTMGADSIAAQLQAFGLLPRGGDGATVIDLSYATSAPSRPDLINTPYTPREYRLRPGEHRTEAEAVLRMAEDDMERVGGEQYAYPKLLCAIAHALLDLGEVLRDV